ncbi:hypothetical protein [Austwickia chelonae]|uniref:hypothetical protein n=1 Tax=Austwickia chelonae TaxID=100225 RepID=UPI000E26AAC1|nr:hypothetical protein [Austwickia chelonae]
MPNRHGPPPDLTELDDPDLRRFAEELGRLWPTVEPLVTPMDEASHDDLYAFMVKASKNGRISAETVCSAAQVHGDLGALRAGWTHFTPGQKAVLNAATAFVLEKSGAAPGAPACPAGSPTDRVLSAAVRTLLNRN